MSESDKSIAPKEKNEQGGAASSPFVFALPPVTDTSEGYADADEARADIEGEMGIKVNTAPSGSQSDPPQPPEGDPEKYRGQLDGHGNLYNPERHRYPPEQTATGRWRKHPRKTLEAKALDGPDETPADIRAEAQKLAMLYGSLHLIPFGAGGAVKSAELVPLIDAYERYMMAHGAVHTPPSLDAVLSSIAYSATVSQRPANTGKLKNWTARLWVWIQGKRTGRKRKPQKSKARESAPNHGESSTERPPAPETTSGSEPRFPATDDGDVIVPDILGPLDRSV